MATVHDALLAALDHHENGRPAQAEILYRRILDAVPQQADAWHLLGVLHGQGGRVEAAEACFRRAAALDPGHRDGAANHGKLLLALGREEEAAGPCRTAVRLRPDAVEPWLADALRRAARLRLDRGALEPARRLLSTLVAAVPGDAVAQAELGLACQRLGRDGEAERGYRAALGLGFDSEGLRDNLAGLLTGRGLARQRDGDHGAALDLFAEARALSHGLPERGRDGWLFTGVSLHALGRHDAAVRAFAAAVAHDPASPAGLDSLGRAWFDIGETERGVAALGWRRALDPGDAALCVALARALERARRPAEAALWHGRAAALSDDPAAGAAAGAAAILCLNLTGQPAADIAAAARRWAARHAEPLSAEVPSRRLPDSDRPLRVGYLCENYLTHDFTCLPLVEHHGPGVVPVVYALGANPDNPFLGRYAAAAALFRRVDGLDNAALAALIRADGIDILVDGAGFSSRGQRLLALARRPAPVQIHFPVMTTTGLSAVDAVLADAATVPHGRKAGRKAGQEAAFTERVLRLPVGYHYAPLVPLPEAVPEPPMLRTGRVTFGSFNMMSKLSAEVFAVWAAILRRVPGSRLIVKALDLSPGDRRALARAMGEAMGDAVEIRPPTDSVEAHMAAYNELDIHLDSFPYGGVTTTAQALWMGVPVVTLAGQRVLDRYGASLLRAVRLDDLASASPEGYADAAVALAGDPERLRVLRGSLRARMQASSLSDPVAFARHVERAYRALWRRWCAGQTP